MELYFFTHSWMSVDGASRYVESNLQLSNNGGPVDKFSLSEESWACWLNPPRVQAQIQQSLLILCAPNKSTKQGTDRGGNYRMDDGDRWMDDHVYLLLKIQHGYI